MFENEVVKYKDNNHFMELVPVGLWESYYKARYNRDQLNLIGSALPLKVLTDKGVDVDVDFKIKSTDLNTDASNNKYRKFHNNGNGGVTFKIDVIIDKDESWGYGKQGGADFVYYGVKYPARARIKVWLDFWYTNMTPLYIVSDAIDVPNGKYIISNNPTRKQNYRKHTVWTLEFTTYRPLDLQVWEANPSLSKYTGKTTANASAKNTKLANCELKNFIYSPNKKENTTQCTRWLQEKLYQLGFMDKLYTTGWYNNDVANAVKEFQSKYQKYYTGMKPTGKMDKITLEALSSF